MALVIVKRKVQARMCGDRRLPANPAYEKTVILKTAPQNFRWLPGAKAWA